jgi:hypothetical protein
MNVEKAAVTNRHGEVYLLVQTDSNFYMVRSAAIIGSGHHIIIAGDGPYVQRKWNEFVREERNAIADNYEKFLRANFRPSLERA